LALLIGPFAILGALLVSPDAAAVEAEGVRSGTLKKCPHCAEFIKSEAKTCRFCAGDVSNIAPIGPQMPIDEVVAQLASPDPRTRERAVIVLGDRGPAAVDAVTSLHALREDVDPSVRQRAHWAMEQILR